MVVVGPYHGKWVLTDVNIAVLGSCFGHFIFSANAQGMMLRCGILSFSED